MVEQFEIRLEAYFSINPLGNLDMEEQGPFSKQQGKF